MMRDGMRETKRGERTRIIKTEIRPMRVTFNFLSSSFVQKKTFSFFVNFYVSSVTYLLFNFL